MKNNRELKAEAIIRADYVRMDMPQNENQLIKELQKHFDGFTITERKGGAEVYAEICETLNKIGWITFTVSSCKKFFSRDSSGKIINIEYTMEDNLDRAKEREALQNEIDKLKAQLKAGREFAFFGK